MSGYYVEQQQARQECCWWGVEVEDEGGVEVWTDKKKVVESRMEKGQLQEEN